MSNEDLIGRLRSTAIFQTSSPSDARLALIEAASRIDLHPAEAASALVQAAANILLRTLEPEVVAAAIASTMLEALGQLGPQSPTASSVKAAGDVIH